MRDMPSYTLFIPKPPEKSEQAPKGLSFAVYCKILLKF